MTPDSPQRRFDGRYFDVELTADGLLVYPRQDDDQFIWWEELRRIEWPEHGRVRLVLVDGRLDFDESFGDLRALVEATELAATEARARWGDWPLDSHRLEHWFGLDRFVAPGYTPRSCLRRRRGLLATPRAQRQGWASAAYAVFVIAAGVVAALASEPHFIEHLADMLVSLAVLAAIVVPLVRGARRGPTRPPVAAGWPRKATAVAVDEEGLVLDGLLSRWGAIRSVSVDSAQAPELISVTLRLGRQKCSFDVDRNTREAWAFEVIAAAAHGRLEVDHNEPPPDNALSLTRLTDRPEAERGLSLSQVVDDD